MSCTNVNIELTGAVKIKNMPELECFSSFEELLQGLAKNMTLVLPGTITNVVLSNQQPSDSDRNAVWIRQTNAGGFAGIYLFNSNSWKQIFPVPQGIFWMYGDSREVPSGYVLVDSNNIQFVAGSTLLQGIMAKYIRDTTDTYYEYFACTFEGF